MINGYLRFYQKRPVHGKRSGSRRVVCVVEWLPVDGGVAYNWYLVFAINDATNRSTTSSKRASSSLAGTVFR